MRLLVVEDEVKIREILVAALVEDGHSVFEAGSAEVALEMVKTLGIDGFLLDVVLPGMSGNELCVRLRGEGVKAPILFLTARSGVSDKVEGLDAGADDYMTKPFAIAELKARVRALQRKLQGYPRQLLVVGDLELDPDRRRAARGGLDLGLSPKEYDFLEFLVKNKDRLVTRAMVSQEVWDTNTALYTNVIDVLMTYLRRKVDGDRSPHLIHTVRGKGFMISEHTPGALP